MASGGSNAGPTNPDYLKTVGDRVKALRDTGVTGTIPADLVQASASGLDPHITPEVGHCCRCHGCQGARRSLKTTGDEELVATELPKDRQLGLSGSSRG